MLFSKMPRNVKDVVAEVSARMIGDSGGDAGSQEFVQHGLQREP